MVTTTNYTGHCEIGAWNVDMVLDVDALLGVRLTIAREVDDSDDGLPQVWCV